MISSIEALNYRCLRYVQQPLGPFHILVGPNASGKTTFLDVIAFLGQFVSDGLEAAIFERTQNFHDLVWGRADDRFELAVEAMIPAELQGKLARGHFDTIRYEIALGIDHETEEAAIQAEKVLLKTATTKSPHLQRELFPAEVEPPQSLQSQSRSGTRTIVNKVPGGNDNFYSEVYSESGKGWAPAFKLGPRKSALGNMPEDESKFPVTTWLKGLLTEGVQRFVLNSADIRRPSPPAGVRGFKPDGSNLPWVIHRLRNSHAERFREWIAHVQTALPDILDIDTVERPEDRSRYLMICYRGGLTVPSWVASDGTLRLLALTLPAYLPEFRGIYLIEEPENGIHPKAVETVFQSLSSVYDAQILLATHSPVILSLAEVDDVLCFARTPSGATDIVAGRAHPMLRDWQGEVNLGLLFARGVLG